jgi:hypothetical protein
MQGSVEPQVEQRDSQMLPPDRAGGVQSLPLQDLFEQLHTSSPSSSPLRLPLASRRSSCR